MIYPYTLYFLLHAHVHICTVGGEAKKFAGLVKSHLEKDSSFSVHITGL